MIRRLAQRRAVPLALAAAALGWAVAWPARAQVGLADPARALAVVAVSGEMPGPNGPVPVGLGEGPGVVITRVGLVLTTYDTVAGLPPRGRTLDRIPGAAPPQVTRFDIALPTEGQEGVRRVVEATLLASDPELNLAVLALPPGRAVSWLPLGDSDVLEEGDAVAAFSPSVGGGTPDAPRRGRIGAMAAGTDQTRRWLQTGIPITTTGSGDPVLDEDGTIVGILQVRETPQGLAIGALPVNVVKDFLEAGGLSGGLPRRLRPGAPVSDEFKGLRLTPAGGFRDGWGGRTRWASAGSDGDLVLRIDRVASPLPVASLEHALLEGAPLGEFAAERRGVPREAANQPGTPAAARRAGWAVEAGAEEPRAVAYAVIDLGPEKILARYEGPAEAVAYNRQVLRRSLESLEARPLITQRWDPSAPIAFEVGALPGEGTPGAALPAGWTRETAALWLPSTVPPPDAVLSASPPGDFTVSLRVLWWRQAPPPPHRFTPPGGVDTTTTDGAYGWSGDIAGLAWSAAGQPVRIGEGLLLLDLRAPAPAMPGAAGLLPSAVARVAPPR